MPGFNPTKRHLREVMLYFFLTDITAAAAHRFFEKTYGNNVPSASACEYWFRRFRSGNYDLEDQFRIGRTKKYVDTDLKELLDADPSRSRKELAAALGIGQTGVWERLKAMGMKRDNGVWVRRAADHDDDDDGDDDDNDNVGDGNVGGDGDKGDQVDDGGAVDVGAVEVSVDDNGGDGDNVGEGIADDGDSNAINIDDILTETQLEYILNQQEEDNVGAGVMGGDGNANDGDNIEINIDDISPEGQLDYTMFQL